MMSEIKGTIKRTADIAGTLETVGNISGNMGVARDYNLCANKPSINGTELIGDTELTGIIRNYSGVLYAKGWGNTAPFMQAVDIAGITSDMSPVVDIVLSDDIDTAKAEQTAWSCLTKAVACDNRIIFYCYDTKPVTDIIFKVKAV